LGVGASSPMTVLAGGIIATYAATGVVGTPLSFLVLGAAVGLLLVGYVAMARHVRHAASFYAIVAVGINGVWGVAAGAVAVVSYYAVQISLYGLFGFFVARAIGGPWWLWAAAAWVLVAVVGVLNLAVNAKVLAVLLVAEIVVIAVLDWTGFRNPAGGAVSFAPLAPSALAVNGVGGVFALGFAALIGPETVTAYGEEARESSAVARAVFASVAFVTVFYTLSAWAVAVAAGPDQIADKARDPKAGLPFSVLDAAYGRGVSGLATLLLITSVFAAMLSFHTCAARYVYALARERVLPVALARVGSGRSGGVPVGGSLMQSVFAALIVAGFVVAGADPFTTLFTWLSTTAAVGVLVLFVASSVAALRFFHRHRRTVREGAWVSTVAPTFGGAAGLLVLGVTVWNIESLLNVEPGSGKSWVIPGLIVGAAVAGLAWGVRLRSRYPAVYAGLGRGVPHPLAVPEARLSAVGMWKP
jgi:amino acid transporter